MLQGGRSWVARPFRDINNLTRRTRRGRGENIGQLVEIENDDAAAIEANQPQPSLSSQLRAAISQPNTDARFTRMLLPGQQPPVVAAEAAAADADEEHEIAGSCVWVASLDIALSLTHLLFRLTLCRRNEGSREIERVAVVLQVCGICSSPKRCCLLAYSFFVSQEQQNALKTMYV